MAKYSCVEIDFSDSMSEIILNRPDKRNALTFEVIQELTSAFSEAAGSDALGILFSARGSVFSAGHDFSDLLKRDVDSMRELIQASTRLMQSIHEIPQPVVAEVQGPAVGAGCQLAF